MDVAPVFGPVQCCKVLKTSLTSCQVPVSVFFLCLSPQQDDLLFSPFQKVSRKMGKVSRAAKIRRARHTVMLKVSGGSDLICGPILEELLVKPSSLCCAAPRGQAGPWGMGAVGGQLRVVAGCLWSSLVLLEICTSTQLCAPGEVQNSCLMLLCAQGSLTCHQGFVNVCPA